MRNPWIKKNPFLSMWLSGANSMAGSMRGLATAEGKRQAQRIMQESAKQVVNFWSGFLITPQPRKKRNRR